MPHDHFAHLGRLLDLEAAAERDEARRRAELGTADDGRALVRLALRDTDFGLGGRLLLTFAPTSAPTFPPNRLGPGSPVVVTQTKPHRGVSLRGVVFDRTWSTIGVAVDPQDDELPDDAGWRLDLTPDEISRQRQQAALRRAASAKGDRLAELRGVLLGEREPKFAASHSASSSPPLGDRLNPSQLAAIDFALSAHDIAVVHGPPGTGKTTTVAELIRRAVANGERVLATAASNHAVDNLLDKLLALGLEPVRLGHPARVEPHLRCRALDILADKHPDAKQARKLAKEAGALFRQSDKWTRGKPEPGAKAAMRRDARALLAEARKLEAVAEEKVLSDARVVCGTLTGLNHEALGRFDRAVIDEAAQATEPAAWLAVVRADRLVLAGDHRQLPPTVVSPKAAADGLGVSLMERVVGRFGDSVARLLTVQYRMHAAIMAFPNAEFYAGRLEADASVVAHRLAELPGVADDERTAAAVTFLDTAGASYDEVKEEESGSRANPPEAGLVVKHVRRLLAAGVAAENVAVISPYRAQVRLLRERLADIDGLEIDSVDAFQGREKEAVVVSLVRSNPAGEVGFLADTRRTNVAFTRARRCLIVVGDGATLASEAFYQRMLTHVEATGAYRSVWEETE